MEYRRLFDCSGCAWVGASWIRGTLVGLLVLFAWEVRGQDTDWFESKVRPLLAEKCWGCHGNEKQWGGLRLDSKEGLLKGGESGPVFDRNDFSKSAILRRVLAESVDERMPPPDSKKELSPIEKDVIREWIARGADWPNDRMAAGDKEGASGDGRSRAGMSVTERATTHWSFQPMLRRSLPVASETSGNWIDAFLQRTLDDQGLVPLEQVDRRTQLRRLSRAITGLFPTWEEVKAYEDDPNEDAWERAVDGLLSRPETAEKWARFWMDIARYSDTKGYVYGREERTFVFSRAYRDWLVESFARDRPYDEFIRLQLAADQLVPAGSPDLAALGFITLGRRFLAIQYDIIDDRIDTTFRGLMGLTVQCARCHDHKYDPITAQDYYSLVGVFQSCIDLREEIPERIAAQSEEFRQGLRERKAKLKEFAEKSRIEANDRIQKRFADYLETQVQLEKYPEGSFNQLSTKEDLIPALVHRWEWFLGLPQIAKHPVMRIWSELSRLPAEGFEEQAKKVLEALDSEVGACHPTVRSEFVAVPKNIREVADRYGKIVDGAAAKWKEELETRVNAGEQQPIRSSDPEFESLRELLVDRASCFYIPDEPIDSTEWYWDNGTCVEIWKLQVEVDQWLMKAEGGPVEFGIVRDRELVSDARMLKRGNANAKGALVPRRYFQYLGNREGDASLDHGSGRLQLAERIVSPENPLTARVWVNRVWQQIFGEGLVQSASDFGARSDLPSHPELLDALAIEFIEHGWSTRWLIRELVTTQAFRRRSHGIDHLGWQEDPANRFLWRMNRHRLTWEESRDSLLQMSGQMLRRVGGKSVEPLAANEPAMSRRSIYTTIDRQYLPMTLQNFDFANPDMHSPKRSETVVPQQALFFMNHPLPATAAVKLVEDIERSYGEAVRGDDGFVEAAYRRIFQRDPSVSERARCLAFLNEAQAASTANSTESPNPGGSSRLNPRAQWVQVLLISNEVSFID